MKKLVMGSLIVTVLSACGSMDNVERQAQFDKKAFKQLDYVCQNLHEPRIRQDAPATYVVQKGDTLISIAKRYLHNPWAWRALWKANPHIRNPHRIYPGDVLSFEGGQLSVSQRASTREGLPIVKLTPTIKELPLDLGIPTIEYDAVKSILSNSVVVEAESIKKLPYIVEVGSNRLMGSSDVRVYVAGGVSAAARYNVYRQGPTLTDKRAGRVIGVEMYKTGEIIIEREDESLSSAFVQSLGETPMASGDYLIINNDQQMPNLFFDPIPAPQGTEAQIISSPHGFSLFGLGQTVVLSQGLNAGLQPGHVLLVQSERRYAFDPKTKKQIALPAESLGSVMVYKVFDHASYAIITQSPEPIHMGNWVTAPSTFCQE